MSNRACERSTSSSIPALSFGRSRSTRSSWYIERYVAPMSPYETGQNHHTARGRIMTATTAFQSGSDRRQRVSVCSHGSSGNLDLPGADLTAGATSDSTGLTAVWDSPVVGSALFNGLAESVVAASPVAFAFAAAD